MERSNFLKLMALLPAVGYSMKLKALESFVDALPATDKMPVLFTSHGNPMEMLAELDATPFWSTLNTFSKDVQSKYKVNAILIISAHWCTRGTYVNVADYPETKYDFQGFPAHFYEAKYPAPGHPELAKEISELIGAVPTQEWGFDHGSWPVLRHLAPQANIPVVQMSIDYYQSGEHHYDLAKRLKPLREKGVLIIGSGAVVHNLRDAIGAMSRGQTQLLGYEQEYDSWFKEQLDLCNIDALVAYEKSHKLSKKAAPTPDHYVPLIYSLGLKDDSEEIIHTYEELLPGFSNRGFRIG